jgi:hypothetical protein
MLLIVVGCHRPAPREPLVVTALAAAGGSTCALTGGGGVLCNQRGQLGDGTTVDRSVPVAL